VHAKARVETIQRSRARKTKQQMDAEWKTEVLRKSKDLGELQGLRKNIQRITVALEQLTDIKGDNSNKEQISWLESEGKLTKV